MAPQRLAFVHVALREIDATHALKIQKDIEKAGCETAVLLLPEIATLQAYGVTLAARGAFFFRHIQDAAPASTSASTAAPAAAAAAHPHVPSASAAGADRTQT